MTAPIPTQFYTRGTGTASTDVFFAVISTSDPTTSSINYPVQKRWVNTSTGDEFFLYGYTAINGQTQANWIRLGQASGPGIVSVTGNSGGAVFGDGSNNVNIVGDGTSIDVVGNPGAHSLTISYIGAIGGITKVITQVFTASGTYTPTTNMAYCLVQCQAGGGGGGCPDNDSGGPGATNVGGGGGAGEYRYGTFSAADIGASKAVTIGAGGGAAAGAGTGGSGGPSSLGALLVANGGAGGAVATISAGGGAGGSGGSGGDFNIPGERGSNSYSFVVGSGPPDSYGYISGAGSSSFFGSGAPSIFSALDSGGVSSVVYGGGGSGGVSEQITGTPQAGGNGGQGIIIITEFVA